MSLLDGDPFTFGTPIEGGGNAWFNGFDLLNGSQTLSIDPTYTTPRTDVYVPVNALQSTLPIASASEPLGPWGTFFQDTFKGIIGYSIAKDAAQNGIQPVKSGPVVTSTQAAAAAQRQQQSQLSTLLLVGAVVYFLAKAAK